MLVFRWIILLGLSLQLASCAPFRGMGEFSTQVGDYHSGAPLDKVPRAQKPSPYRQPQGPFSLTWPVKKKRKYDPCALKERPRSQESTIM